MDITKVLTKIAGASLIIAPIAQMVAFAIHPQFLTFQHNQDPAVQYGYIQQFGWQLGHILVYATIPFALFGWIKVASLIKEKQPWFALVGGICTWFGSLFMAGAFGAVMAQGAVGLTQPAEIAVPTIQTMLTNSSMMQLSFYGSILGLLGPIILLVGLWRVPGIVPKWSAPLALLGNAIIIAFMDIDGYMIWGSFCILIAMLPLAVKLLRTKE